VDTQYGSVIGALKTVQNDKAKIVKLISDADAWARGREKRGITNDRRDRVTLRAVLPTLEGPEYANDPSLIPEMYVENFRTREGGDEAVLNQNINATVDLMGATSLRVGTLLAGIGKTLYKVHDRRLYVPDPDNDMPGQVPIGAYYLFDKDCVGAAEILKLHDIEFRQLKEDVTIAAKDFQWFDASIRRELNTYYEGRLYSPAASGQTAGQQSGWVGNWKNAAQPQKIPAGTYVVSTSQPKGNLAAIMLEPGCMDGLLSWKFSDVVQNPIQINFFDNNLDKKEGMIRYHYKSSSGEDYVPIFKVTRFVEELKLPDPDPESCLGCNTIFLTFALFGVVPFVIRRIIR